MIQLPKGRLTGKEFHACVKSAGYTPGPWMAPAQAELAEHGEVTENLLADILAKHSPDPPKEMHTMQTTPAPWHCFLPRRGGEGVEENFEAVSADMARIRHLPGVIDTFSMPDACPTGDIPVGSVVATQGQAYPIMTGSDIGCSVLCMEMDGVEGNQSNANSLASLIVNDLHFGNTPRREWPRSFPKHMRRRAVEDIPFEDCVFTNTLRELAEDSLGTQGDGNHFVNTGVNEMTGNLVVTSHFGGRGVGAAVYKAAMREAEKLRKDIAPSLPKGWGFFPVDHYMNMEYRKAIDIVLKWTIANHAYVTMISGMALDLDPSKFRPLSHTEHNRVVHDYDYPSLLMFFKGAIPAATTAAIPLNMDSPTLLVAPGESTIALPHGAGRLFSRTAFKKMNPDPAQPSVRHIFVNGVDVSEYPEAYKDPDSITSALPDLDSVVINRINPLVSIMAGGAK